MASTITYFWKLFTCSFSLPFRIFGYRFSAGFWCRWTRDSVDLPPPRDWNNDVQNRYKYRPLPHGKHIRVLELHPGSGSEPLCGTLHTVSLDDGAPDYEALSYVWGLMMPTETIRLDHGQCLPLRENLRVALHCLRQRQEPRRLWIDALCIYQDSMDERAAQITLMAEVYSRCQSVCVWLGLPTAPHSQLGMDMLSFLADGGRIDDRAPWNRVAGPAVEAALGDLLERPYFHRLWVVQEAALAPRITMCVGHLSLAWSRGAATRRFLMRIKLAELSPPWRQSEALSRIDLRPLRELLEKSVVTEARQRGTIETPSLLDIVHSIRHRNVADQRDSIYGAMSLVTPSDVAGFVVDYGQSWEETYQRFYDLTERQVLKDRGPGWRTCPRMDQRVNV